MTVCMLIKMPYRQVGDMHSQCLLGPLQQRTPRRLGRRLRLAGPLLSLLSLAASVGAACAMPVMKGKELQQMPRPEGNAAAAPPAPAPEPALGLRKPRPDTAAAAAANSFGVQPPRGLSASGSKVRAGNALPLERAVQSLVMKRMRTALHTSSDKNGRPARRKSAVVPPEKKLFKVTFQKEEGERRADPINATTEEEEEVEEEIEEIEARLWLEIFDSTPTSEWLLFTIFATFFLAVYYRFFLGLLRTTRYPGVAILCWIAMAALYNFIVYLREGKNASLVWTNGYLLELVFSLENVFVFHVIVESFAVPRECVQKVLFWLVCFQICVGLLLYMGLADVIVSMKALPYILGAWLVYLGATSALSSDDHSEFNILDHRLVRLMRWCFGERLVLRYHKAGRFIGFREDGSIYMTMLGLVLVCLALADLFLEVDVTLTKIEQSGDPYLAFTSSALAAFAVPELFFVGQDLFRNFPLVKYGIAFILFFFGFQMLLPGVLEISPLDGCGVIGVVMVACIITSALVGASATEDFRLDSESSGSDVPAGKMEFYGATDNLVHQQQKINS